MTRAAALALWLLAACTKDPPAAPPPADSSPAGSPRFCPGDDASGVPLVKSTSPSSIDLATARRALDERNELCGDTWCEGSFEWFFYDLRGTAKRSELTMRAYTMPSRSPAPDVSHVTVTGAHFTGRVLGQHEVRRCTSPCKGFATPPDWTPCLVLDLRCALDVPASASMDFEQPLIDCGIALETAVRALIPEFPPGDAG